MTNEQESRYERPKQLRDILKRVLEGWICRVLCGQCGIYHITRYGGDIMCDFDDGDYMDEDSFENEFNDEVMDDTDDLGEGLSGDEQESDEFTAKGAFFIGSIVGNAYEESMDGRKRRELLRKKRTKRNTESD